MYQKIHYNEYSSEMIKQLEKGLFITTKVNQKINTMTIAWGHIGIIWGKPVFIAYVRYTRDTFKMLEQAEEFTISVPLQNNLKKELSFCGTKSGRDYDKINECDLKIKNARIINTPILADCELHYECKVIYKQAMEPGLIPNDVKQRYYKDNNYHMIYYGEIVDSYILKERENE
ncbi:flavin reductase [Candidatus Izimaplasma bacterium ZiA1]|uniref:flavin reductase family protein n=1 Tax=Candidatus Izimoplasma sp. ZiA1 TaxID=2024899 RepID=UPI000BAA77E7|nr:flavin reductase [Candidatus Izimaplasma bacterium ZiA1]